MSVAPDDLNPTLSPGMRVRLDGAPINTTLTSSTGKIVAEDLWDTYIVRLDSPAIYHNEDGTEQRLDEIRVLSFNLMPINQRCPLNPLPTGKDVAGIRAPARRGRSISVYGSAQMMVTNTIPTHDKNAGHGTR